MKDTYRPIGSIEGDGVFGGDQTLRDALEALAEHTSIPAVAIVRSEAEEAGVGEGFVFPCLPLLFLLSVWRLTVVVITQADKQLVFVLVLLFVCGGTRQPGQTSPSLSADGAKNKSEQHHDQRELKVTCARSTNLSYVS